MAFEKKITIDTDLGIDYCGSGRFRPYGLSTYGNSYYELLNNVTVSEVDQDGGEIVSYGLEECSREVEGAVEREIRRALSLRVSNAFAPVYS